MMRQISNDIISNFIGLYYYPSELESIIMVKFANSIIGNSENENA